MKSVLEWDGTNGPDRVSVFMRVRGIDPLDITSDKLSAIFGKLTEGFSVEAAVNYVYGELA